MKDFERFLTDLPKPDAEVRLFRDRLRRELRGAARPRSGRSQRLTLGLTAAAAGVFGLLIVLFIVRPAIPVRIHSTLAGTPGAGEAVEAEILTTRGVGGPLEADREFIESWSARQERPVGVRSMEAERLFNVRQFELTDGKRMLVFSEIGEDEPEPALASATAAGNFF